MEPNQSGGASVREIRDLYQRAYAATPWPETAEAVTLDRVRGWLDEREILFIEDRHGHRAGAVQTKDHWIKRLVIDPDQRKNGLGSQLLGLAELRVSEEYDHARLRANAEQDWLVDWYERLGYERFNRDSPQKYPFDLLIMGKDFE